jgi:hypothetical protein
MHTCVCAHVHLYVNSSQYFIAIWLLEILYVVIGHDEPERVERETRWSEIFVIVSSLCGWASE